MQGLEGLGKSVFLLGGFGMSQFSLAVALAIVESIWVMSSLSCSSSFQ